MSAVLVSICILKRDSTVVPLRERCLCAPGRWFPAWGSAAGGQDAPPHPPHTPHTGAPAVSLRGSAIIPRVPMTLSLRNLQFSRSWSRRPLRCLAGAFRPRAQAAGSNTCGAEGRGRVDTAFARTAPLPAPPWLARLAAGDSDRPHRIGASEAPGRKSEGCHAGWLRPRSLQRALNSSSSSFGNYFKRFKLLGTN